MSDDRVLKIGDIAKIRETLELHEMKKVADLAVAFKGIRIIENPLLAPNEMALMCGSDLYEKIKAYSAESK